MAKVKGSGKRVSSIDVARLAGVSQATVSRVFTPAERVSDELREKVMKAAMELNYQPNILARGLNMNKTRIIGLINPEFQGYFYPKVLKHFTEELQKKGYTVLLLNVPQGVAIDEVVPIAFQYQVDGLITTAVDLSPKLIRSCVELKVPVVQFNRYSAGFELSAVCLDNVKAGEKAAEYLLEKGHKRIAFLSGYVNSSTNKDREEGLKRKLQEHGYSLFERYVGDYTYLSGLEAGRRVARQSVMPDAIFCGSDEMAMGLIDALSDEHGLTLPDELSVMGFNDSYIGAGPHYKLTSIKQPVEEMVSITIDILMEKIVSQKDDVVIRMVPGVIVERGSVKDHRQSL